MKVHTSDFKEQIKSFGRELDSKITYEIGNEEIELGKEELNSVSPHYEGAILKSVMKQLDIDSNVEIPIGTILRYQFGVKVDGEYEYIDYGNYVVYSIEKQEDTNSYKITCYDKMLYAMKEYENSDITFPIAIKDYLEAICEKIGLEYEESPFANDDKIISNELFLDSEGRSMNYTFRDVLDQIAEASGGTICINKDDKLEIRYIHDVGEITDVSNSSIEITDGEEAELQAFELEGKTAQEATPTPDYPSKLNSVGYENIINFANREYKITNYYYRDFGTSILITEDMVGKVVSFSYDVKISDYTGSETTFVGVIGRSTNNNGMQSNIKTSGYLPMPNELTNIKIENITIPDYVGQYLILRPVGFSSPSTANIEVSNVQLTYSSTAHTYIPYDKYGIEVKMIGKNLFDKNSYQNLSTSYEYNIASYHIRKIQLEPNTNYTVSHNAPSSSNVVILINNIQQVNGTNYYDLRNASGTKTITTDSTGCLYIGVVITFTNEQYNDRINECNIQIEKGNAATTFEAYKENSQLYTLDEPLRSIGDTKDLLYIRNGMLYVERKIGSVVLDGSESWSLNSTSENQYRYWLSNDNFTTVFKDVMDGSDALGDFDNKIISNYFIYKRFNNTQIGSFSINNHGNALWFLINSDITSVNDFKTWLSTHNTEVDYLLTTPYTEEIGQVQMPSTYDGITYIQTTDLLEPTMNVSYISEFEEIDEEYLKDVNVNFGEKFGPVNTIVLSRGGDGDKISASIPADLPDENKVAIQITDNQIMNGNDRNEYMAGILNKIYGLEYYINDFTSTGICYLDLCDRYRIKIGDTSYKCVMFNDEANITQGLSESIYTDLPKEEKQEYKYMSSTDRGITQANIIAKKNEAEIVEYTQKLDDTNNRINAVETKQTETDRTINIISTNIDANGNITEVTTTTGFTFNADGMAIKKDNFEILQTPTGAFYKEGDNVVGQYTKDGSKQKDLQLFGVYYYGMDDIDDTPMFVAQLYTDNNGVECFGHFYNRGDN